MPYLLPEPALDFQLQTGKNISNITVCPLGIQWIWRGLGDCVSSPREQASAYLGLISLVTWMIVGIPQIVKNCRHLEGLAGVSPLLLLQLAGGDIANLTGAILTSQLKLQIYLACYFVLTDVVLLAQLYVFFLRRRRRRLLELQATADPTPRLILCFLGIFFFQAVYQQSSLTSPQNHHAFFSGSHQSRSLLSVQRHRSFETSESGENFQSPINVVQENRILTDTASVFWHDKVSVAGYVIGILSSICYIGSRLAQIYKNIRSESTQGLAVLTFMLAVFGNLTYGAQILARDVSSEFLLEKTPWLVGSLGVVLLDCLLLYQFWYYHRKHHDFSELSRALMEHEYVVNAEEGESNEYIY